jgi:hypothetical protein
MSRRTEHFRHSPGSIGARLATAMEPCTVLTLVDVGVLFGISRTSVARVEREALFKCFVRLKVIEAQWSTLNPMQAEGSSKTVSTRSCLGRGVVYPSPRLSLQLGIGTGGLSFVESY